MPWPVDVVPFGSLEAGTLLWTRGGALHVTLVLRTTYALGAGPPTLLAAGAVEGEDHHYQGDPARAVRTAADLAPRVPRADIVHAGAVIAPAGITVVRLALFRQGRALFDKRATAAIKNDSTGLGPLGRAAPQRRAALRGAAEPTIAANGVIALPDDFDFTF